MARARKQVTKGGPYLAAALICERVLADQDGAMSAIRIVDQFTLTLDPATPPELPSKEHPIPVTLSILLILKTGDSPGEHAIRLDMQYPSGKSETAFEQKIQFQPQPQSGANLRFNVTIRVHSSGLFWMDVFLDSKRITRMPFQITIQRADAAQQPAETPAAM
jgi:hypothetical protein